MALEKAGRLSLIPTLSHEERGNEKPMHPATRVFKKNLLLPRRGHKGAIVDFQYGRNYYSNKCNTLNKSREEKC
ncbi:MAG: hypothetical protein M0Z59_06560 [Nitrospiraceae bacterium]|nr:hypothetical protein [Nitrospiraceae bacterium]